jgi:hypothetical protein
MEVTPARLRKVTARKTKELHRHVIRRHPTSDILPTVTFDFDSFCTIPLRRIYDIKLLTSATAAQDAPMPPASDSYVSRCAIATVLVFHTEACCLHTCPHIIIIIIIIAVIFFFIIR